MRLRYIPAPLFTLSLLVLSLWLLYAARQWPWESRLFPMLVASTMAVLGLVQLTIEIVRIVRGIEYRPSGRMVDLQVDEELSTAAMLPRAAATWGWLLGFLLAIYLVGFVLSIGLYVLLYLLIQGREKAWVAVLWAAITVAFTMGVFDMLLHTRWLVPVIGGPEDVFMDLVHRYIGVGV